MSFFWHIPKKKKFDKKSFKCIKVRYTENEYHCLDEANKRIVTSRNVQHDEGCQRSSCTSSEESWASKELVIINTKEDRINQGNSDSVVISYLKGNGNLSEQISGT